MNFLSYISSFFLWECNSCSTFFLEYRAPRRFGKFSQYMVHNGHIVGETVKNKVSMACWKKTWSKIILCIVWIFLARIYISSTSLKDLCFEYISLKHQTSRWKMNNFHVIYNYWFLFSDFRQELQNFQTRNFKFQSFYCLICPIF